MMIGGKEYREVGYLSRVNEWKKMLTDMGRQRKRVSGGQRLQFLKS